MYNDEINRKIIYIHKLNRKYTQKRLQGGMRAVALPPEPVKELYVRVHGRPLGGGARQGTCPHLKLI